MQEYGWLHWNDLSDMLRVIEEVVGESASGRKLRLAACSFARRIQSALVVPLVRSAIELAEDFADFRASREQLKVVRRAMAEAVDDARQVLIRDKQFITDWIDDPENAEWRLGVAIDQLPVSNRSRLVEPLLQLRDFDVDLLNEVSGITGRLLDPYRWRADELSQCLILRDVLGNPFRQAGFDSVWRTDTAVLIAKGMYESRDFGAMPILADALQDAGCENDDILNHCRDANGIHVRGCWVVDLVLGKD
jgi:hypothetical protein